MEKHQVRFDRPGTHLLSLTVPIVADAACKALTRICGLVARGELPDIAVLAKKRHEDLRPGLGLGFGSRVIIEEAGSLIPEALPKRFQCDRAITDLPLLTGKQRGEQLPA